MPNEINVSQINPITALPEKESGKYEKELLNLKNRFDNPVLEKESIYSQQAGWKGGSDLDTGFVPGQNQDANRAINQPNIDQFGNMLAQTIFGEIGGGIVEGVGNLIDLSMYKQAFTDSEDTFSNILSELGGGFKEDVKDAFPIYTNYKPGSFSPGHFSWWMSNLPSVASFASMIVPATLAVKGLSGIAKIAKLNKILKLGKSGIQIAEGVTGGIISNHIESIMEAKGGYDERYNYLIEKGVDPEEAREEASKVAAEIYDKNKWLLLQNIPQYMLFNNAFLSKSLKNTYATLRAEGKNVVDAAFKAGYNVPLDMIGEGGEEIFQNIVQEEAKYLSDVALGYDQESSFFGKDRLGKYMKSGDTWTSFMFGALGAGVMQTGGKGIKELIEKTSKDDKGKPIKTFEQERVKNFTSDFAGAISHATDEYKRSMEMGSPLSKKQTLINMIAGAATSANFYGNYDKFLKFIDVLEKGPTDQDIKTFGLEDTDLDLMAGQDFSEVKSDVERIGKLHEAFVEMFDKGELKNAQQVIALTRETYLNEKYNQLGQDLRSKVDNLKVDVYSFKSNTSENDQRRIISAVQTMENNVTIENLQKLSKYFAKAAEKETNDEMASNFMARKLMEDIAISQLKNENKELAEARTPEDVKKNKSLNLTTGHKVKDFVQAKTELDYVEETIKSTERNIKEYTSNPKFFEPKTKEDPTIVKEEKETFIPDINDIVEYTIPAGEENAGTKLPAIVKEIDPTDPTIYKIDLIDEKQEIIPDSTITVTAGNINLDVKEDLDEGADTTDPVSDNEEDGVPEDMQDVPGELVESGSRLGKEFTQITYSHGKKKSELRVFDEGLDNLISDPNTDLSKATIKYEIAKDTLDKILNGIITYKDFKFTQAHKDFINKDKKTKKEIEAFLASNPGIFNSVVDHIPIRAIVRLGAYNGANNAFIYRAKDETERKLRKKIIGNLLLGYSVTSIEGAVKRVNSGFYNSGKTNKNISTVFGVEPNKVELGLGAKSNGVIYTGIGNPSTGKTKKAGGVYIYTNKTPDGKKEVPVKVNPQKLTPEHAEILWDALKAVYTKDGDGWNAKFPDDRVEGLRAGEIISFLVLYGAKRTAMDYQGRKYELGEWLRDKQLYVNKGEITFGQNTRWLNPKKGDIDKEDKQNKADFIKWATTHKNYTVTLDNRNSKSNVRNIRVAINQPLTREFRIGKKNPIVSDGKSTYTGVLISSNMIMTDVELVGKGKKKSVFKSPILAINNHDDYLKIEKKEQPVEVAPTPKKVEEKKAEEVTRKKVELGNNKITDWKMLSTLEAGTELYYTSSVRDPKTGVVSEQRHDFAQIGSANGRKFISIKSTVASFKKYDGLSMDRDSLKGMLDALQVELYANMSGVKKEETPKVEPVQAPIVETKVDDKVAEIEKRRKEELLKNDSEWSNRALSALEDGVDISQPESPEEEQAWKQYGTPFEQSVNYINAKYDAELAKLKKLKPVEKDKSTVEVKPVSLDDIQLPFESAGRPTKAAPYVEQNWEKEVDKWLTKRFGKNVRDLVQKRDRLIQMTKDGPTLFGLYQHSMIQLYKGAETGTIYHEAFHRVSMGYLNPMEREAIYKIAKIKYKMLTSTDEEIEEVLAEKFRDFVIEQEQAESINSFSNKYKTVEEAARAIYEDEGGIRDIQTIRDQINKARDIKKTNLFGAIMKWFVEMFDFIKSFFGENAETRLHKVDIDHLFGMIQSGRFKYSTVSNELNKKNKGFFGLARYNIKGKELQEVNTGVQAKNLITGMSQMLINSNGIEDINDINELTIDWKPMIDGLKAGITQFENVGKNAPNKEQSDNGFRLANLYTELVDDLESKDSVYRQLINEDLRKLNIRLLKEDENDQEDEEVVQIDTGIEQHIKASYETDGKKNVLASIKFLIKTLPKSNKRNPFTFMYDRVDFADTWNALLKDMGDLDTIEEMIAKLRSYPDNYSYNRLATILEEKGELTRKQFQTALRMHRHSFVNIIRNQKWINKDEQQTQYTISDADVQNARRAAVNTWNQNLYRSPRFVTRKHGIDPVINVEAIEKLQAKYASLVKQVNAHWSNNKNFDTEVEVEGKLVPIREVYKQQIINALNTIFIEVDERTINHYMGTQENYDKALFDLIIDKASSIFGVALNEFKTIKKNEITKLYWNEKSVKFIGEIHVDAHPELINDSIIGPESNMYYTYSLNSYTTDIVRNIRKNGGHLEQVLDGLYGESLYARQLLADPKSREQLKLLTFSAALSRSHKEGVEFLKVAPIDDYLLKLHFTLDNKIPFPTLADKKTYYLLQGIKRFDNRFDFTPDGRVIASKETVDLFYGYFQDELKRINHNVAVRDEFKDVYDEYKLVSKHPLLLNTPGDFQHKQQLIDRLLSLQENLKVNYHYRVSDGYKDSNGIIKIEAFYGDNKTKGGNAYRFSHFNEFNKGIRKADFKFTESSIKEKISQSLTKGIQKEIDKALSLGILANKDDGKGGSFLITEHLDHKLMNDYASSYGGYHKGLKAIIADFTVSTFINNIEIEKLFIGDPAFYKSNKDTGETQEDKIKRLGALPATGNVVAESVDGFGELSTKSSYRSTILNTQVFKSSSFRELKNTHVVLLTERYVNAGMEPKEANIKAKIMADKNLKGYEEVDATDAQVYITPEMYRSIAVRLGEWSKKKEKAFNLLESGRDLTVEEEQTALDVVLGPLKLVYFALQSDGKYNVPLYDKMSLATLFRPLVKGTHLESLADRMEAKGQYAGMQTIHMAKFDTAVKVGAINGTDFYKDIKTRNEVNDFSSMHVTVQQFKYLRRQLVVEPHAADMTRIGTQFIKVALSNLIKDKAIYNVDGNVYTGDQLLAGVNSLLTELSNRGVKKLDNKLGFSEGNINLEKFVAFLREELLKADGMDTTIDSIKLDGDGNLYLNLDSFPDRDWIQSRIISLVNKYVVDRTVPGKQLVQMTSFGIRKVVSDTELKFTRLNKDRVVAMESRCSINLFKKMIPDYENKTWKEKVDFLKANKLDEIITYRIPTQGMSSIAVLKVVEFLPEAAGDTIMLPYEFTTLTGSDFDIDKLFVVRYNYVLNKEGRLVKVKFSTGTSDSEIEHRWELRKKIDGLNISLAEFKKLTIVEQNTEKAIQNRLLSSYMSVLMNKEHFVETTTGLGSLKTDMKGIEKRIRKAKEGKNLDNFEALSPSFQGDIKAAYSGGKDGIPAYALNNVHHVLGQMVGLSYSFPMNLGGNYDAANMAYDLSKIEDKDGVNITDWLSVLIDAHVDIAKDPYIVGLNVNDSTHKLVNLLLRSGFGESTFYFISQPILFDYAEGLNNSRSVFTQQVGKKKIIKNLQASLNVALKEEELKDYQYRMFNKEFLLETHDMDRSTLEWKKRQSAILTTFVQLDAYATKLFELVQACQVDTKKYGSNLIEVKAFINRMKMVLKDGTFKNVEKLIPFIDNMDRAELDPSAIFISNYAVNSVLHVNEILSKFTMYSTPAFVAMANKILKESGRVYTQDTDFINIVYKEIFASIAGKFFRDEVGMNSSKLNALMLDEHSLTVKLAEFQEDPVLRENGIFKYLSAAEMENDVITSFFRIPISRISEKGDKDDLVRDWEELLSHEREDVRKFAKNLWVYSFYASGFRKRMLSFHEFSPTSILKSISLNDKVVSYDDYIKEKLAQYSIESPAIVGEMEQIVNDVFQNNWMLNSFVPEASLQINADMKGSRFLEGDINKPIYLKLRASERSDNVTSDMTSFVLNPYVKIYMDNEMRLFKRIGIIGKGDEKRGFYIPVEKRGHTELGVTLREYFMDKTILETNKLKYPTLTEKETKARILGVEPDFEEGDAVEVADLSEFDDYTDVTNQTPLALPSPNRTEYTPENIQSLKPNEIFVFGSNIGSSKGGSQTHGRGAALLAKQKFGAKQGQSEGLQGQSYAIITKKYWDVEKSSTLQEIQDGIKKMLDFATKHTDKKFLVTKIGSSLAGYSVEQIAELFDNLKELIPSNVVLPREYTPIIGLSESISEFEKKRFEEQVKTIDTSGNPLANTNIAEVISRPEMANESVEDVKEVVEDIKNEQKTIVVDERNINEDGEMDESNIIYDLDGNILGSKYHFINTPTDVPQKLVDIVNKKFTDEVLTIETYKNKSDKWKEQTLKCL